MSVSELVRDAVKRMVHLRHEEGEVTFADLFGDVDFTVEEIADLQVAATEYRIAAADVGKVVDNHLAGQLKDLGRSVSAGDTVFWYGEGKRESCIDSEGFLNWAVLHMQENPRFLHTLINPNSVRKGAIPPAVRDTFFEKVPDGKLQVQSAPAQVLEDARQKKAMRE